MSAAAMSAATVDAALRRAGNPERARDRLTRLLDAQPALASELADAGPTLDAVVALAVGAPFLLDAARADLGVLDPVRTGTDLRAPQHPAALHDEARQISGDPVDVPRALRRWKRRKLCRIAARDLLGLADLRTVGSELAALADACLTVAVAHAAPSVPFAVIGMGKLGGSELNYASDVDVLFVHDGDAEDAERAARAVLRTMSAATADGYVFRTDARLRPEGAAGALSRSLDGYVAYWERWARAWELQALLKARVAAGDAALGARFMERATTSVFSDKDLSGAVREIRAMKQRAEAEVRGRGLEHRELKRGRGGIRDIEFSVQLLQLVHGRHDDAIRSPSTLVALEQLASGGYVALPDAVRLDDAYVWLRTVEHRLQLIAEQQTHTLPSDEGDRTDLARVLGFRDRGDVAALAAFDATHQSHVTTVRAIHEKLFFAPVLDTLAGVGRLAPAAALDRLSAFGFRDAEQTRAALVELTAGLTRRSRVMHHLMPVLLGWLSETPDPDLGLLQLRRMVEGPTRSATFARRFRETPIAAERTCRVLGASRVLGLALHRAPEFLDVLADDDALLATVERDAMIDEALGTLDWRHDDESRYAGLRRFKRRHLLRIGARDLLGIADVETVGRELSALADACVAAALGSLEPPLPFAVVGMGRLGGCELSYASDIDVLFVYDGDGPDAFAAAERVATELMRAIGATTAEGQTFRIDADLRPEGKAGPLARSLRAYDRYYREWVQTWERQALTRARPVAGDDTLASAFIASTLPAVYRDPLPADDVREIRRMKARIERERIPAHEDPRFHLKLGRGSLSDVEFTVQLLQLTHGARHDRLRAASTVQALDALESLDLVAHDDAAALRESFRLCERARNYRYLLTGTPSDALPVDSDEATKLARMLGYVARPQQALRDDYRRVTRRARDVVERLFYGRTA
ncbi:MAG TPA: bifunctional [glutamine synthetase] adenylyltransferase/[glutamine synthetase]-adenylyl-L-tyrosine phosphorylase [Acidimicrobiia bacterium]|nr:bifunctional [glutamine synthetase] adenylyltransferase/[glutamine synthetase]-adenylyl-L-tyrosine phosphorylase [Acidimicrobiia bacterium]